MMTKKNQRVKERMEFLSNCDRGGILLAAEYMLMAISEFEQYFKERNDIIFFLKHTDKVIERENRAIKSIAILHKLFGD